MSIDKIPPHNDEAEEAALGSLLIGANINEASIKSSDFFSSRNQLIYSACERLKERSVAINQITVANELNSHLVDIGGSPFLSHLVSVCPTSLDYKYYCDILTRLSFYRRMIEISKQIEELGFKADSDITQSVNKADDMLLDLRKQSAPSAIKTPKDKAQILFDRYAELNLQEGDAAISTGLYDVDKILGGGFYPGDLTTIGARTGMGKTTLLQNLANNMSRKGNVLIFSCEMGTESLGDRDVASMLGVSINTIRWGKYSEELFNKIAEAVQDFTSVSKYANALWVDRNYC
jgi:replicative DNA helicase